MRLASPRISERHFFNSIMFILHNSITILNTFVYDRKCFTIESKKDFGEKYYYHSVTCEFPDEGGKVIFYLMPSLRLPSPLMVYRKFIWSYYTVISRFDIAKMLTEFREYVKKSSLKLRLK